MRYLISVLLLSLSTLGWAATELDIYQASQVLRVNAGAQEEREATRQAMLEVMIRATGRTDLQLEQMPRNPDSYISGFGYLASDEVLTNRLGDEVPTQRLQVDFDPISLQRLANDNNWGFWPNVRPDTLLWVMVDDGRKRTVSESDNDDLVAAINNVKTARGLSTSLPLWDTQDQFALPQSSLWGLFSEDIILASQRYEADWNVAIKIQQSVSGWQGTGLVINTGQERFDVRGESPAEVLELALQQVADWQAAQFSLSSTGYAQAQLVWQVSGINSYDKYHALLTYLTNKVAILSVQVAAVDADLITLQIDSAVDEARLWSQLSLEGRLQEADTSFQQESLRSNRLFNWRR
ncbi:DUF2066 domain-containing protein [Salinibius halmophilus]|uniref:DUF2066 domain-containing protein n=1 Tax=Salinibius halmophilus TaxID=1853216 RepID=UPI0013142C94|nr:DUF2066 domain-containing protein [Salinibius halmophilus]